MYLQHFGLLEKPFENNQDPKYFYLSAAHSEAMSRLVYVSKAHKPLFIFTGDHGTGKTTVLNMLRSNLDPNQFRLVHVQNPLLSIEEIFHELLRPLSDSAQLPEGKGETLRRLREAFVRNVNLGRHNVVVIDEAHLIEDNFFFEEIRMLLNYQYNNETILSLILAGQSDLRVRVNRTPALRQRVSLSYNLKPLEREETAPYIIHRLRVAGFKAQDPPFAPEAFPLISNHSGGLPRIINNVCDLALLMAFHQGAPAVDPKTLEQAFEEIPSHLSEGSAIT